MTAPKLIPFDVEHIRMAQFAAALAHPARMAIVTFLQGKDTVSFKEIVNEIPLAQATISQHIKTLLEAGLLLQYPNGPRMSYALNCEKIQSFCHQFQCTLGTQNPE
ncbi:helix-turn-helix domain-containing protein [Kiritimatiellaeota bacterium B1221]|nr:helix-turn-helix domain-containing protein [Kiritimatiellaeota bacterium B1221]